MFLSVTTSMFKTKLIIVYCERKFKSKTSFYRISSTWFYENYFKAVLLWKMHIMLRCFYLFENKEHLLEHILNILDVNKHMDFENKTIEMLHMSLMECTIETSFENTIFGKWKQIMQCASLYVHRIRNRFTFDCRC